MLAHPITQFSSNIFSLHNLDRPICRAEQKRIYGVGRNEAVRILCEVDSYPPPKSFKWTFNNTAETIDMPQNGFEKHSKSSSKLLYTPVKVSEPISPFCKYIASIHDDRKQFLEIKQSQRRTDNDMDMSMIYVNWVDG